MTVLFRFTIYQANGTTPDLTVTSQRGGSNPYIVDVPSGDGQEVDLLTGAVRSGAYVVTVADIVTGTDGTGTVRLITNKLEDNQFRQQLLSRRAKLECSRDGGSTYSIWTLGYLTGIQQVDAITYSFTVSDSRRIESTHTIFTWSSDPLAATDERREFPNRGCLVGGPTIQNFGPIRASGGWEFAWREVQSGYLALAFVAAYDPPSYARTVTPPLAKIKAAMQRFYERQPPIADLTGDNYKQIRERQFVNAYPSVLAIVESGASVWYGTVRGMFTPPGYTLTGLGQVQIPPFGDQNYLFVQLTPGQSTSYPSTNAKVRVRLVSQEVAPESALYIDEHPVDIVSKLYETVNIPFNAASVTSTKAAVGTDVRLALRITEPVNMGEFLSSSIFGPFGFSVRTNAAGEQEFFPTRISNSATPTITIANADIVGDTPPAIYDLDEGTVVTGFRLTSTSFSVFDQDPELRDPPPPDGLTAQGVTIAAQNADTSTYSTKEVKYEIPGMIHDGSASNGAFAFSPEVVQRFFTGIVAEGFDRFGRGAVASEVQVIASSSAANLQVGDEVNIAASYYPNKNYRIGESNVGNRIAQIVRRTETPEGPSYKLVDSGVSAQPTAPTFTLAAWSGEPRRIATATVTNAATLNSSNVTLAVQYQVSATTPTTRTGTLFTRFRPGTIPTIAFTLPVVPPGSRVYVRMRTEKTELRASAWTAWTYVDLGAWVAPNSLTTSNVTADAVTFTIGLGSPTPNTLDPLDIFAYPGASAPADWTAFRIGTLSAGSTSTIVRDLTPSTQYTFGVAFRDEGTGAYSGFATATVTTAALNTVSAPAAPKMKLYTSFPNAGQTTGIALTIGAVEGYNIVVQRAPNVSGAPGTFADLDTLPPLTATYVDVLPSDGITRWYRVFYRLSGFLDGTPGTARSGTPIGIPDDFLSNTQATSIAGQATLTLGNYLTGGSYDGSASVTTDVDATPNNTASKVVARDASGNFSAGTVTAALAGNATTATTLQTARNINGVAFDGSADITVTAAAGTLTGTTLASGVTASSLTSVGTIATGVWQGTSIGKDYGGTGLTSTAFTGITNERIFVYDGGSGVFEVGPTGSNGQGLIYSGGALAWGNPAPGLHVLATTTALGPEHSVSGLTSGMILQATGATTARFQTPSIPASSVTAGTFSGASYTITNDLTVSGTLTGTLTGNASTATALQTARNINGVSFNGTADITVTAAAGTLTGSTLASGVTASSLTSVGTLTNLTVTNTITGSVSGNAGNVTGTVAIANGGTNATSYGVTGTGTRAIVYDIVGNAFEAVAAGSSGQFLQSAGTTGDITWATPPNFSTTTTTAGYVPGSNNVGATYFLNANGVWAVPAVGSVSANNVTAGTFSGASYTFSNSVTFTSGVRVAFGETYKILNGGGTAIDVLSATTLGTGVINSSLTSVGTLTSGALGAGFTAIDNARLANSSITINGSSVSLGGSITVSNQTITLSGDVTGSGTTSIATTLADTAVVAGTYGGNNAIPRLTVDSKGRLTGVSTITPSGTWSISISGNAATATTATNQSGGTVNATTGSFSSTVTANRYAGVNSLILNSYQTANPSSNVYLYSPPNDRDAWVYLDSADTGSNWGIYHRQIDSAVSGLPGNSIGFVGAGTSTLQAYISLLNGDAYFAGNVGIGTSSPSYKFDVSGQGRFITNSEYQLDVMSASSAAGASIRRYSTSAYAYDVYQNASRHWRTGLLGDSRYVIYDQTATIERLCIDTSGNVGIGTTAPYNKLSVLGSVGVNGDTNSSAIYMYDSYLDGGSSYFQIPQSRVRLDSSATGGIDEAPVAFFMHNENGTNNTWVKLSMGGRETAGAGNTVSWAGIAARKVGGVSGGWASGELHLWTKNGALQTDAVTITATGNVGIGTNTPNEKLDVNGNMTLSWNPGASYRIKFFGGGTYDAGFRLGSDGRSLELFSIFDDSAAGIKFITGTGSSNSEKMRLTNSGNVGIGTTTTTYKFNVDGGAAGSSPVAWFRGNTYGMIGTQRGADNASAGVNYYNAAGAQRWFCGIYENSDNFGFYNVGYSGFPVVIQNTTGNLGIGTTSPAYKLDVVGTSIFRAVATSYNGTTQSVLIDGNGGNAALTINATSDYAYLNFAQAGTTKIEIGCEGAATNKGSLYINTNIQVGSSNAAVFIKKSDGFVGIGTTSPSAYARLHVNGSAKLLVTSTSSSWGQFQVANPNDGESTIAIAAGGSGSPGNDSTYTRQWIIGINPYGTGTDAFTVTNKTLQSSAPFSIKEGGDVLVNGTGWNGSRLVVNESSGSTAEINGTSNTANQSPLYVWNNVESGSTYFISFYSDGQNNARTLRGYINYRRDNATLNLTTASDYRIKTIHGAYTKSGEVFDKMKVHEGTINGESGKYPMVVAHELQEAYPSAVDGEKDAVNEDGTPKLQMVSYTAMIPLMLAEIKSLRERVAQLES